MSPGTDSRTLTVLGSIRPKPKAETIEQIRQEEAAALEAQRQAQLAAQQQMENQNQQNLDPTQRDLPQTNMSPFGDLNPAGSQDPNAMANAATMPGTSPATNPTMPAMTPPAQSTPSLSSQLIPAAPSTPAPAAAAYSPYQQSGSGFVPPPPNVSLGVNATQMGGGNGMLPPPPAVQYQDPQMAYGYQQQPPPWWGQMVPPWFNQQQQQQAPQAEPQPAHPQGSPFSNRTSAGSSRNNQDDGEESAPKPRKNVVVITPTGMEARSPYKQRDDLRLLFKGALQTSRDLRDPRVAPMLAGVDVGLPSETTKGNISVSPRQISSLFKGSASVDRRIQPALNRVQSELVQSYYRYLYSYNKFCLTTQQVAARKQEAEVAETPAERQRAAADMAQVQNDADAAKEDMKSAQADLASIAGPSAARSVIQHVSGVAPSLESLATAVEPEPQTPSGGWFNNMGSMLNPFGRGGSKQVASANPEPSPEPTPAPKKEKEKEKKKNKKEDSANSSADFVPLEPEKPEVVAAAKPAPPSSGIAFELKNVTTTPRKSILKVSIRNNGSDEFSFDPEQVSVAEGERKLAEASVRAEFDTNTVAPNSEIAGTVTIFGRPWNDRLTVSLSDGGKKVIHLHR